jgi:hypothetical protein
MVMSDRFANLGPSDIARVVLTENANGPRYIVIPTSVTGHCCFDFSVVDRTTCDETGYPPVCECLDQDTATRIAAALNAHSDLAACGADVVALAAALLHEAVDSGSLPHATDAKVCRLAVSLVAMLNRQEGGMTDGQDS